MFANDISCKYVTISILWIIHEIIWKAGTVVHHINEV